jgi:hypothetical protein
MSPLWKNDPAAFVSWGIANGWSPGLEIDRINNDGGYEPTNCRFVSRRTNVGNRYRTVITYEVAALLSLPG